MSWIFTKYFMTAAVVVLVSELAKRGDNSQNWGYEKLSGTTCWKIYRM